MSRFYAKELFDLRKTAPCVGMPHWTNLLIGPKDRESASFSALSGPGLYAVFFDERLIYIGLYAGLKANPFGGSVLDRWSKHIIGQTLRARDLFFKPKSFQNILRIPGEPAEGLARTLPHGRNTIIAQTDPALCPPLKTRSILSSVGKVHFATEHWNMLRPGNEDAMLGHFSFEYQRIPTPAGARPPKTFVKSTWLRSRETGLIKILRPICNRETNYGNARRDVTPKEACDEITRCFAKPFDLYDTVENLSTAATAGDGRYKTADAREAIPKDPRWDEYCIGNGQLRVRAVPAAAGGKRGRTLLCRESATRVVCLAGPDVLAQVGVKAQRVDRGPLKSAISVDFEGDPGERALLLRKILESCLLEL